MTYVHEVFPFFQPLLGLHLMNGDSKHKVCLKHVYYYGKILQILNNSIRSNQ